MEKENGAAAGNSDDLQFDHAEFKEADGNGENKTKCETCQRTIEDSYFEAGGKVICGACKEEVEKSLARGGGAGRFFRAVLFGVPAAALGSGIYYGIAELTGYEFGLVAIVIGLMVGAAVRAGSNRKGGWLYQGLAMILTYFAIVGTYIPYILEGIQGADGQPEFAMTALTWILMIPLACAAPFLAGLENIVGLIIIGIGLYEAWTLNKRTVVQFTGPFEINAPRVTEAPAND